MYDNDEEKADAETPIKQIWMSPQINVLTLCETEGGLSNDAENDGGFMAS